MSIGKNISFFRKQRGFTQTELGELLSVSNQAVSKWESEMTMPDVMLLPEIAKALGVTLDDLYGVLAEVKCEEHSRIVKGSDEEERRIVVISTKGADCMENINIVLAANILKYRKKSGLSQEELANKLGVTFQAVSKWENAKAAPDITFLPIMADIFGCYIDELFSREVKAEIHYDHCPEFPWADDTVIRGVVCEGRKILQCGSIVDRFTFEIKGDAKNVQSECNIEVNGNVSGGCKAGKNINVSGVVSGGCNSGAEIVIGGHLSGGCNSGGDITVGGSLSGGCNTGGDITCGGDLSGDINCGGAVTVKGDVEAESIKGDVICNSLKCDKIEGNVTINKGD